MADYWVKFDASSPAEGPIGGAGLRERASAGMLTVNSLISTDGVNWHPAGRVKGLFDQPSQTPVIAKQAAPAQPRPVRAAPPRQIVGAPISPSAPVRPAPPRRIVGGPVAPPPPPPQPVAPVAAWTEVQEEGGQAEPMESSMDFTSVVPAPPSVGYYVPGGGSVRAIKPRSVIWSWIVAGASLLLYGYIFLQFRALNTANNVPDVQIFTLLGTVVVFLLLMLPTLILWLIWVHGTHKDLRTLTGGHQVPPPGQAVGLSFIPVFDAFWIIYMPWRLSRAVNDQLAMAGQRPITVAGVIVCQSLSVVAAFFFPGLTPILYAASMTTIQRGLDRLRLSGMRSAHEPSMS